MGLKGPPAMPIRPVWPAKLVQAREAPQKIRSPAH